MKSSEDDDFESALPLCPNVKPDAGELELSLDGVPKGVPPIELLDGAEVLEPEPEGVPNPENDDEAEDDDEDEGGLEPVGNPNPEAAAETNAELGGVNPPGVFIPAGGWPPALALEGRPTLSAIELESCEPLGAPAGGNPGYGWFARSALAEEEP